MLCVCKTHARYANHGWININFDVIGACFYLLKTGKLDIVNGDFEATKFQLGYMWWLDGKYCSVEKETLRRVRHKELWIVIDEWIG